MSENEPYVEPRADSLLMPAIVQELEEVPVLSVWVAHINRDEPVARAVLGAHVDAHFAGGIPRRVEIQIAIAGGACLKRIIDRKNALCGTLDQIGLPPGPGSVPSLVEIV